MEIVRVAALVGFARPEGETVSRTLIPSPLGDLLATFDGAGLNALHFVAGNHETTPGRDARADALRAAFDRYWAGEPVHFDVPLAMKGTPFQLRVWHALVEVPYGQTITYAELARRIGAPRAPRAVGRANGANPIAVIVPCHRVVGSNGALTGYGGGIERKRALLELEARAIRTS